jgi:hypothetical protein
MRAGRWAGTGAIVAAIAFTGTAGAAVRKPDLTVAKLSLSKKSVVAGGAVRVTAKVSNKGAKKAPATKLAVYLSKDARKSASDAKLGAKKLRAVKPRKAGTSKLTVKLRGAGTWRLIACADAARKVKERNEKNNCKAATITVTGSPGSDEAPAPAGTPSPQPGPSPTPTPTPAANPINVGASTLDTAHAATQRMAQGTLIATGADGTKYTLTLPAGALASSQDITMTPVTAVAGNPLGGLVGAVKLEPEGIQLLKAATLTIEPPGGVPGDATGFQFHPGGDDFHLYPLEQADKLTLPLTHFSTPGVAHATAAQRDNVLAHTPVRKDAQFEQAIAQLQSNPGALKSLFDEHYDTVVKPALEAAGKSDGSDAEQAIVTGLEWARQVEVLGGDGGARETEMWQLIEIAIRNAIDNGYHACATDHDLTQILRLIEFNRFALLLGIDVGGDGLQKALACGHFAVDFDATYTRSDHSTTGGGGPYDLSATWEMAADHIPVDTSGQGNGPLDWKQFSYHSTAVYPGSSCTLTTTTDQTTSKNITVRAILDLDLTPRETPPPGQPAPKPRAGYLLLSPNVDFTMESYHSQDSGCSSQSEDYTDFHWYDLMGEFHRDPGEFGSQVRIKLDPSSQQGDVIDAEHIQRSKTSGSTQDGESTFIEIFHTPQPL